MVLMVTLVLLVVLSTLAYTLTSRVATQKHRDDYMVDYTKARYACDSAVRYALATLEDLDPQLVQRPNEPDFSDLFAMSEEQYQYMLAQHGLLEPQVQDANDPNLIDWRAPNLPPSDMGEFADSNDMYAGDSNEPAAFSGAGSADHDEELVRGPYGPPWPLVTEVSEFEIGDARITIEIEDENAKYPLGWAMIEDEEIIREADAGFDVFCEWMYMRPDNVERLRQQLAEIAVLRPFKLDFKPITKLVKTPVASSSARRTSRSRTSRISRTRTTKKTISAQDQINRQHSDFGRLLHSPLINMELLAAETQSPERREGESPKKYLGLWATRRVNVNTAPRHVLEAAFTFGGDAQDIASIIIERRRIKPFKDMKDLSDALFSYALPLSKCEQYITFKSTVFTIKVSAVCGVARASSTIAITKSGKKVSRIAVINS